MTHKKHLTLDDFLTGLLGAWAQSKQVDTLPVGSTFADPLERLMPEIEADAQAQGLDCFVFRTDNYGDSQALDSAKAFAYQRGLLELRMSVCDGRRYAVASWASACLESLPGDPDFYRRWAVRLAAEFNTR